MAGLNGTITYRSGEYRPCLIDEKTKALFHRWECWSEIIPPSPMVGGHAGGVIQGDFGIVELENGQVEKVLPRQIRFTDNIFKEYCFEGGTPNDP